MLTFADTRGAARPAQTQGCSVLIYDSIKTSKNRPAAPFCPQFAGGSSMATGRGLSCFLWFLPFLGAGVLFLEAAIAVKVQSAHGLA